ncbi:MAG: hypothetical protein ACOX6T_09975 [Myxococcales bacterium]
MIQRNTRARAARLALLGVFAVAAAAGCQSYDRPNAPFPDIQATGLDGTTWDRQALAGKPWVINLWVPR